LRYHCELLGLSNCHKTRLDDLTVVDLKRRQLRELDLEQMSRDVPVLPVVFADFDKTQVLCSGFSPTSSEVSRTAASTGRSPGLSPPPGAIHALR
jgi:hypothetical protein